MSDKKPSQSVAVVSGVDHKAVVEQVKAIQKVMAEVMQQGVHYGVIPGCKQPSLYKPGSEALLSAFRIAVEPEVERIETDDGHTKFIVRCIGRHMQTGIIVGIGVGEASTGEEKYAWRKAVCEEEWEDTPETMRRKKYGVIKHPRNGEQPYYVALQVRTNAADMSNTVLKMAKKRAQIDMTLTTLAASDMFTQDIEDLPPEYMDGEEQQQAPRQQKNNRYQPQERSGGTASAPSGSASESQVRLLRARLKGSGKTEQDLCGQFQLSALEEMPKAKVNQALDWIAGK